jgi:hypothetical protein
MNALPAAAGSTGGESLEQRRQTILDELAAQRQRMAEKLQPAESGEFPRSYTMRLLINRPDVATRLLAGVFTLFLGARVGRTLRTVLDVADFERSLASLRSVGEEPEIRK